MVDVEKRCRDCKGVTRPGKVTCQPCADRRAEQHQIRYADPVVKARMNARSRAWSKAHPDSARAHDRKHYKETYLPLKIESIRRYGGQCSCCGESDYHFLTLHHANGDGYAHRKALLGNGRIGGSPFVRALAKQGWPAYPGLDVLCFNCHMALDNWGVCPHQVKSLLGK